MFSQNIALRNDGNMYIGTTGNTTGASLYINGHFQAEKEGEIKHEGKTILTGDFINNITDKHVFQSGSTGTFEFKGKKAQHIRGTANKATADISFPQKLIINNCTDTNSSPQDTAAVILFPNMSITVQDIHLERGRFVLDSDTTSKGKTIMGHLLAKGNVTYPADNGERNFEEKGLFQVIQKYSKQIANGGLIGFTPPFKKIYSDYFLFNLVSQPDSNGVFGEKKRLFRTPLEPMTAGTGYFVGIGAIPVDVYLRNINSIWRNADPNERISTKVAFARDYAPPSLTQFVNYNGQIDDQYSMETIVTQDVQVTLKPGVNYLANPFTVPIDMTSFVNQMGSSAWGIVLNQFMQSYYDAFDSGTAKYDAGDGIDDPVSYTFNTTFTTVTSVGGTGNYTTLIPPLGMFKVYLKGDVQKTIKIPASIRTHADITLQRTADKAFFKNDNQLLLEMKEDGGYDYDRLSLVFSNDIQTKAADVEGVIEKHIDGSGENRIYTMSADNKKLVSNALPFTAKEVKVYMKPPLKDRRVVISAKQLDKVPGMEKLTLKDNITGQVTDLKKGDYTCASTPKDREDRFILYFSNNPVTGTHNNMTQSVINIYSQDDQIVISGLTEDNRNDVLSVYDVTGRLLRKHRIQDIPDQRIPADMGKGIYIIRLDGSETIVQKLILN